LRDVPALIERVKDAALTRNQSICAEGIGGKRLYACSDDIILTNEIIPILEIVVATPIASPLDLVPVPIVEIGGELVLRVEGQRRAVVGGRVAVAVVTEARVRELVATI